MRSKKALMRAACSPHTYRNFKVPREYAKLTSPADRQSLNKIQNRRARRLDYVDVLEFDLNDPE